MWRWGGTCVCWVSTKNSRVKERIQLLKCFAVWWAVRYLSNYLVSIYASFIHWVIEIKKARQHSFMFRITLSWCRSSVVSHGRSRNLTVTSALTKVCRWSSSCSTIITFKQSMYNRRHFNLHSFYSSSKLFVSPTKVTAGGQRTAVVEAVYGIGR